MGRINRRALLVALVAASAVQAAPASAAPSARIAATCKPPDYPGQGYFTRALAPWAAVAPRSALALPGRCVHVAVHEAVRRGRARPPDPAPCPAGRVGHPDRGGDADHRPALARSRADAHGVVHAVGRGAAARSLRLGGREPVDGRRGSGARSRSDRRALRAARAAEVLRAPPRWTGRAPARTLTCGGS